MIVKFRGLVPLFAGVWLLGLSTVVSAGESKNPETLHGVEIPDVIARVDGQDLRSQFVKFEFNRVMKLVNKPLTTPQKVKLVKSIIDKEVVRELVSQQGKSQDIEPDPELIEKELQALKEPYSDEQEFQKALQERGVTEDDLKKAIRVEALAHQLLDQRIKGKINISDAAVKKYYDDNKAQFYRPETYRARHIFIAVFPPHLVKTTPLEELQSRKEELIQAAEKKINEIVEEVRGGGDFAELAKKYTHDDATRENGGDLDIIYKGVFHPAFDEAVAKLKPGETSGVVQTEFGYHVVKLIETRPPEQAPFEVMQEAIQKHLFTQEAQKEIQAYVDGLRENAKIEILF